MLNYILSHNLGLFKKLYQMEFLSLEIIEKSLLSQVQTWSFAINGNLELLELIKWRLVPNLKDAYGD